MSVAPLGRGDAEEIVDVLSEAFHDYPVMRFVIGDVADYDGRLHALITLFVAGRALRGDPMFGIRDGGRLIAAVTMSNPADAPAPELAPVKEQTWALLGVEAEQRYNRCVDAWSRTGLNVPQVHVNMIGVRDSHRGTGQARKLLEHAHALCERSATAHGVSLTTELARNVDFYRHFGYDVVGEARIADEVMTWNLFRYRAPSASASDTPQTSTL